VLQRLRYSIGLIPIFMEGNVQNCGEFIPYVTSALNPAARMDCWRSRIIVGRIELGVPMRMFLRVTVACAFLIQACTARSTGPASGVQPAPTAADSAKINCREVQETHGPVLECPAFDLIVSSGQPLPLTTVSDLLSASGLAITESVLTVGSSQRPALRIEKQRRDGEKQIGWATIVVVNGVERNVTCYLRPPHIEEKTCAEGLSQLSNGQLRLKAD